MTPELHALARAYMALPGAPTPKSVRNVRDKAGIAWVILPDASDDGRLRWCIDLTDAATGGVMLALLGPGWLIYQREYDGRWVVSRPDGEHRQGGATLAEAVARVAVAVGRAG